MPSCGQALAGLHLDVARRKNSEKAAQPRGLPGSGRSLPGPVGAHKDRKLRGVTEGKPGQVTRNHPSFLSSSKVSDSVF